MNNKKRAIVYAAVQPSWSVVTLMFVTHEWTVPTATCLALALLCGGNVIIFLHPDIKESPHD